MPDKLDQLLYPEFYALCTIKYYKNNRGNIKGFVKKKRNCYKCNSVFLSQHGGGRSCGSCSAQNSRASKLASVVPKT